jgi:hypothetical protein
MARCTTGKFPEYYSPKNTVHVCMLTLLLLLHVAFLMSNGGGVRAMQFDDLRRNFIMNPQNVCCRPRLDL